MLDKKQMEDQVANFREKLFIEYKKHSKWFGPKYIDLNEELQDEARELFHQISKKWIPNYLDNNQIILNKLKELNKILLHINYRKKFTKKQIIEIATWVNNF